MIPQEFFVTSGKASSTVSELNAFDMALKRAGIAQCNLVSVSSILPKNCKERRRNKIPVGSITHAVLARMIGNEGTTIGSGIAWAWEKNLEFGIVAETHGYTDRKAMMEILEWKIMEMAKIREIEINGINYMSNSIEKRGEEILFSDIDHAISPDGEVVFLPSYAFNEIKKRVFENPLDPFTSEEQKGNFIQKKELRMRYQIQLAT